MVVASREVSGDPPSEQNRPQQVEWIDQVIGLLGKEMVIEELGMAVVEERESMLALGRLNRRRRGRTFLYLHYLNLPRLKR